MGGVLEADGAVPDTVAGRPPQGEARAGREAVVLQPKLLDGAASLVGLESRAPARALDRQDLGRRRARAEKGLVAATEDVDGLVLHQDAVMRHGRLIRPGVGRARNRVGSRWNEECAARGRGVHGELQVCIVRDEDPAFSSPTTAAATATAYVVIIVKNVAIPGNRNVILTGGKPGEPVSSVAPGERGACGRRRDG